MGAALAIPDYQIKNFAESIHIYDFDIRVVELDYFYENED